MQVFYFLYYEACLTYFFFKIAIDSYKFMQLAFLNFFKWTPRTY